MKEHRTDNRAQDKHQTDPSTAHIDSNLMNKENASRKGLEKKKVKVNKVSHSASAGTRK